MKVPIHSTSTASASDLLSRIGNGRESVALSCVEPRDSLGPDGPSHDMSITSLGDGSFESKIGIVSKDKWHQVSLSTDTGPKIGVTGDLSSDSLAALRSEVPEGEYPPSLVEIHESDHKGGYFRIQALRERHEESVPNNGGGSEYEENVTEGNELDAQKGAMVLNAQLRKLAVGLRRTLEEMKSEAPAAFKDLVEHLDDKVLDQHMKFAERVDHQHAANVAKRKQADV
jgi:hypothetical protein